MQKIPFETIQKCINKDDFDFPTLIWDGDLRTPEMIEKYKLEKKTIKNWWEKLEDYILVKFLKFKQSTKIINSFRKSYAIYTKKSLKFSLEKSEFPYNLIDIRFHYILWVNSKDKETIRIAIEIEKLGFAGENYIYFQNEPKNQSVPEITHFHFLIK